MTPEDRWRLRKLIEDYTRRATASRETARAALIASGIYTKDGKLAPQYGGEE